MKANLIHSLGMATTPKTATWKKVGASSLDCQQKWGPYLLSPGLSPCSNMPAEEGTGPPPELLSALELWEEGSGPAGAKVLPSVGGSGGWKAGDICFLFRVPPRRWAWKSISFTPKLHREKKQSAHHASQLKRRKPAGPYGLKPQMGQSPTFPGMQLGGEVVSVVIPVTKVSTWIWL